MQTAKRKEILSWENFAFMEKERSSYQWMTWRLGSMGAREWGGWVERKKREYLWENLYHYSVYQFKKYWASTKSDTHKSFIDSYDIINAMGAWYDMAGERPPGMRVGKEGSNKEGFTDEARSELGSGSQGEKYQEQETIRSLKRGPCFHLPHPSPLVQPIAKAQLVLSEWVLKGIWTEKIALKKARSCLRG